MTSLALILYIYARIMNEYSKNSRQALLRSIIIDQGIGDQNRLITRLRQQGVETTQATISRDLQEMGFIKVRVAPGQYRYEFHDDASAAAEREHLRALFKTVVTEVDGSANIICVRTLPANANGIARLIDSLGKPEILGTVAGDDTILIALRDEDKREVLIDELKSFFE